MMWDGLSQNGPGMGQRPEFFSKEEGRRPKVSGLMTFWWAQQDSNLQPRDYESPALTVAP